MSIEEANHVLNKNFFFNSINEEKVEVSCTVNESVTWPSSMSDLSLMQIIYKDGENCKFLTSIRTNKKIVKIIEENKRELFQAIYILR